MFGKRDPLLGASDVIWNWDEGLRAGLDLIPVSQQPSMCPWIYLFRMLG
ncbi:hypothetical protein [Qipengyuania huizhouensis]|nr:hypothetical protein [Qipengyuania huizhouensis]MBA4765025.1 hypothetical protein [Erythrobacter sp.]MBX7460912.1 hypothetical protein [Qipengyuania huizhouensis]